MLFKMFILMVCAEIHCEDGVFNVKHNGKDFQFDLTR